MNFKMVKDKEIGISEIVKFLKKIKNEEDFRETERTQLEFKEKSEEADKIFSEKGEVCFMDNCNICLIALKTKRLINLALGIFGKDIEFSKRPYSLIYKIDKESPTEIDCEICSKYSGDYLQIILELCKYGNPNIFLRRNYPLTVELEEIGVEFILAPRVEN